MFRRTIIAATYCLAAYPAFASQQPSVLEARQSCNLVRQEPGCELGQTSLKLHRLSDAPSLNGGINSNHFSARLPTQAHLVRVAEAPSAADKDLSVLDTVLGFLGYEESATQKGGASPNRAIISARAEGLAEYLKMRESWGVGIVKEVKAPLANGATTPLPRRANQEMIADRSRPILRFAEPRPLPHIQALAPAELDRALRQHLATRASQGKHPSLARLSVSKVRSAASLTAGSTGDLPAFLAQRASWGTGQARTIRAPLAKGANRRVILAKTSPVPPPGNPITSGSDARPLPRIAKISQQQLSSALQQLLERRESWKPEFRDENFAIAGALDSYLAQRKSWGRGPVEQRVCAPLAKINLGASLVAQVTRSENAATVQVQTPAPRPLPKASKIAPGHLKTALRQHLAQRESSGGIPSKGWSDDTSAQTIATIGSARLRAALTAQIAERESWGSKPIITSAAFQTSTGSAGSGSSTVKAKLSELLAQRKSWGSKPVMSSSTAQATPAVASHAQAETEIALKAYLAERESWSNQPTAITPPILAGSLAPLDEPTTLEGYLKRRAEWQKDGTGTLR